MAQLPSRRQLVDRQQTAEESLRQFKLTYESFMAECEKIINGKKELLTHAHKIVDSEKLSVISNIIAHTKTE